MNEIRIRAVMKRTGCGHELHTSFCRKQQSKIEVLYSIKEIKIVSNMRMNRPKRSAIL